MTQQTTSTKALLAALLAGIAATASLDCGGSEGSTEDGTPGSSDSFGEESSDGTGGNADSPMPDSSWVPVPYRGVNLSGAEFGEALPGIEGRDYWFPTNAEVDYFMSRGMNTFRVGFKWERLQPALNGDFDAAYFGKLQALVAYATEKGAHVILNPHNFARYGGKVVGSGEVPNAAFADLWKRLATTFAGNDHVQFGLVNEPHDIKTEQWLAAANDAIAAIRAAGASNLVLVPGNAWTGAHSWAKSDYGTSNAVAMLGVVDPGDNYVFEVHQYLDGDASGASDQCVSPTIGRERLTGFVDWLRKNGKRAVVGEIAGGRNETCSAAIADMVKYMMDQSDVLVGWLWWGGGPAWGDHAYALDPASGGADRPQMALLAPYLLPITPVVRTVNEDESGYCTEVGLHAWSGLGPAVWQKARVDVFDGVATSTVGAKLSGETGQLDVVASGQQATIPAGGRASFMVCANKGTSGATLSVVDVEEVKQ